MKSISMIVAGAPTSALAALAQRTKLMGLAALVLAVLVSGLFVPTPRSQAQKKPDGSQQSQSTEAVGATTHYRTSSRALRAAYGSAQIE